MVRPWWTYPNGHSKKTEKIELLQQTLKKPLEGFSSAYLTMDAFDLKGKALIKLGKWMKELYQKKKESKAKKNNKKR